MGGFSATAGNGPAGLHGLEGEDGFPHRGKVNFVNNQVNPSTGTIAVRGVFSDEPEDAGRVASMPGMFVRVRLPLGQPHKAQLVIDRAIGSDQGLKFVYVVDAENKVQYRRVTTGALQEDGLRVIEPYKPADGVQEARERAEARRLGRRRRRCNSSGRGWRSSRSQIAMPTLRGQRAVDPPQAAPPPRAEKKARVRRVPVP